MMVTIRGETTEREDITRTETTTITTTTTIEMAATRITEGAAETTEEKTAEVVVAEEATKSTRTRALWESCSRTRTRC